LVTPLVWWKWAKWPMLGCGVAEGQTGWCQTQRTRHGGVSPPLCWSQASFLVRWHLRLLGAWNFLEQHPSQGGSAWRQGWPGWPGWPGCWSNREGRKGRKGKEKGNKV
jgi:hypothetical protein